MLVSTEPGAGNQLISSSIDDFENRKTHTSIANLKAIEEKKLGAFEYNEDDEEEEKTVEFDRKTGMGRLSWNIIANPDEKCYRIKPELLAKMPESYEFRDFESSFK